MNSLPIIAYKMKINIQVVANDKELNRCLTQCERLFELYGEPFAIWYKMLLDEMIVMNNVLYAVKCLIASIDGIHIQEQNFERIPVDDVQYGEQDPE